MNEKEVDEVIQKIEEDQKRDQEESKPTDHPATPPESSSPESAPPKMPPPPPDPLLLELIAYIRRDWRPHAVAMHLRALCSQLPAVCPPYSLWNIPRRVDVSQLVHDCIHSPGYIESVWPSIRLVMGSNVGNVTWCASVLTSFALFSVIGMLPSIMNAAPPPEAQRKDETQT